MFSKSSNIDSEKDNIIFNHNNNENYWNLIEKKWLDYWNKNRINNSDIDNSKKKFFITVDLSISKFAPTYRAWANIYFGRCSCSIS